MGTSCDLRVESLADHPELLAGRLGSWAWSSARKTGGGEWAVSCWTACRMPPRHLATLGPGLRPATKRLGSISAARPSCLRRRRHAYLASFGADPQRAASEKQVTLCSRLRCPVRGCQQDPVAAHAGRRGMSAQDRAPGRARCSRSPAEAAS